MSIYLFNSPLTWAWSLDLSVCLSFFSHAHYTSLHVQSHLSVCVHACIMRGRKLDFLTISECLPAFIIMHVSPSVSQYLTSVFCLSVIKYCYYYYHYCQTHLQVVLNRSTRKDEVMFSRNCPNVFAGFCSVLNLVALIK